MDDMNKQSRVLITGGQGMLGRALNSKLSDIGIINVNSPSRAEMDCLDPQSVNNFFYSARPTHVFHLASLVYGIKGNLDNQNKSLHENTLISMNVLNACMKYNVSKVFYAGTVASYGFPYASLPLKECDFWSGPPHDGEYGYGWAKRMGLIQLEILKKNHGIKYTYGLLTNLYGPHDKFNSENGHVIPSLISKAIATEQNGGVFEVWGKPNVTRDFMYSKDAASAIILSMTKTNGLINISSGLETPMSSLVSAITQSLDNNPTVKWRDDRPIGIERRYSDNSKLNEIGFHQQYSLEDGIKETIKWYKENLINN